MKLFKQNKQSGFTLLEAIVAMVVFTSVGAALFAWLSVILNSYHHSTTKIDQLEQTNEAIKVIKSLNMMGQQQGNIKLSSSVLYWKTELIEPIQKSIAYPAGVGLYDVGLYKVYVWVEDENKKLTSEFTIRQTGYKQARKRSL